MTMNEISILLKLFIGALSTFFAILLWSKTRDIAWIMIIAGTLIDYANIVIQTLTGFGLLSTEALTFYGIPVIDLFMGSAPKVLYIIGFIVMIRRNKMA
jgi:hypothetical protein